MPGLLSTSLKQLKSPFCLFLSVFPFSVSNFRSFAGSVAVAVLLSYQMALWITLHEMCYTNNISLPCFASCWVHTHRGFLNSTVPAVRTEYLRVTKEGNTGNCQVWFLNYKSCRRCGWFFIEEGGLSLSKKGQGACGEEKKKESVCMVEKPKTTERGKKEIKTEGSERRRGEERNGWKTSRQFKEVEEGW